MADHSESLEFYIVHPDLPGIAGILTINVKETVSYLVTVL